MITLNTGLGLLLYLFTLLTVILCRWIWDHWRARPRTLAFMENKLYVCEFCHFSYLVSCKTAVHRCPVCRSWNKSNDS